LIGLWEWWPTLGCFGTPEASVFYPKILATKTLNEIVQAESKRPYAVI
jgi:hypothetical protein